MTLQKKVKCEYHKDGILASMHPEFIEYPSLCPWCRGKLEYDVSVSLYNYEGEFAKVDWEQIDNYYDDIYVHFKCECGDEISLNEGGDTEACSCGRIYRLYMSVKVDETHIGEIDWLIEESNKK